MTLISGWLSLVLLIFGFHRWVAMGVIDPWARYALIGAAALFVTWIWGFGPQIWARLRGWTRGGGLNTFLIALALIVALVVVNVIVRRRVEVRWDLTKNQRFTLAPRTRDILKSLPKPVEVTAFLPRGARNADRARDLLKQYEDASPNFKWKQVDPTARPDQYLAMQPLPKLGPDLTGAVLQLDGKRQDITEFTERDVTSAILKMTRDSSRRVVFLKGHGEALPPDAGASNPALSTQLLSEELKTLQWQVETVDLYGKDAAALDPAKDAVLVIAGPERPFTDDEQKRLNDYLNKGGRVLLFLSVRGPSLQEFLKPWGIRTQNDLVVDPATGAIVHDTGQSPHAALPASARAIFLSMRSVQAATPAPEGVTVTELIRTEPTAIHVESFEAGKTNLQQAIQNAPQKAVSVAAVAEKKLGTGDDAKTGRLVVVGDTTFTTDQGVQMLGASNRDLAAGLVNYLGEEDALVSIPPKDENTEQVFVDAGQLRMIRLLHYLDFPLLALLLAIGVYLKRR